MTMFHDPLSVVGDAGTDVALRVSPTPTDDENVNTGYVTVVTANGDLAVGIGGHKVLVGPFIKTNLLTSASAVALAFAEVTGMTQMTSPYAGSVIGVSACGNANITASTARFAATVNGATVFSAVNAVTTVKIVYGTQAKDVDAVAAGDRIGLKVTTTATYAPETIEWVGYVILEI